MCISYTTVSVNFNIVYLEYLSQNSKTFKSLYDIIPTNAYSNIIECIYIYIYIYIIIRHINESLNCDQNYCMVVSSIIKYTNSWSDY